ADDLLSTILLAATAPILVAPAMNAEMLAHPATQANLDTLRQRGVEIVEPGYGLLACRTEGWGKLADVETIVEAVVRRLTRPRDLEGKRVIVTAGATREPLDPVRFLSNRSSGKMGFALAEAARDRGADVVLLAGPTSLAPVPNVEYVPVVTSEEMRKEVVTRFPDTDVLIMAAAVADFRP